MFEIMFEMRWRGQEGETINQLAGLERGRVVLLLRSGVTFASSLSPNATSKSLILLGASDGLSRGPLQSAVTASFPG